MGTHIEYQDAGHLKKSAIMECVWKEYHSVGKKSVKEDQTTSQRGRLQPHQDENHDQDLQLWVLGHLATEQDVT